LLVDNVETAFRKRILGEADTMRLSPELERAK
jgi:hypothetical protein